MHWVRPFPLPVYMRAKNGGRYGRARLQHPPVRVGSWGERDGLGQAAKEHH